MNPLQARYNERLVRLRYQEAAEAETAPGSGSYESVWADVRAVPAVLSELSGRELVRAGQIDAETPVIVRTRYAASAAFTAAGRFVGPDGRAYDIRAVRDLGRRDGREFVCVRHEETGVG